MSLSLRTINAPGTEITEVDRSQYSQTLTGTKVLVAGYADKGEDCVTISPTSRSTLINVYGKPTNEEERYFYEACKEVIQQGGVLYSARLPYDNEMAGRYTAMEYQLNPCSSAEGETAIAQTRLTVADLTEMFNDDPDTLSQILSNDEATLAGLSLTFESDGDLPNLESDTAQSQVIAGLLDGSIVPGSYSQATYLSSYETTNTIGNAIHSMDSSISNIQQIGSLNEGKPILLSADKYDEYATGEDKPYSGRIAIIDITRGTYGKTPFKGENDQYYKECIGIVPVITTAANALFTQMLLSTSTDASQFNIVKCINSLNAQGISSVTDEYPELSNYNAFGYKYCFTLSTDDLAIPFGGEGTVEQDFQKAFQDSITSRATAYFPAMYTEETASGKTVFNRENFKKIGIVVFRAYIDTSYNNKINFDALEAFVGSLDPQGVDLGSGANNFIDNIVNTQSEYIRVFSNAKPDEKTDILQISNQPVGTLGFYESMTKKDISYKSMVEGLNKVFDTNSDLNEKEIDIVVDAGVSTIAGFVQNEKRSYDPTGINNSTRTLKGGKGNWRSILSKYDSFCKNTRKDCMFIGDGMRQFCLQGKKKIVRPSKPENTIDTKIIPNLIDMQVLNTNYGAGYCDWFEVVDEFSGDSFWCPPSIKACGVYIYTDRHANYWDAPAGLNRGMVSANDVAFNPNVIQAGPIYLKNWNYAINYPDEGVILEGQKTMQMKPSAFDRVNVRRLFLRLERFVWKTARYFVYEPNTAYTRSRFVDALTPYFSEVKTAGGMYDFKIICDESINTPEVIDNNELRVRIGIKPTKTIEFILIEFVALKTGASWSELTNI